MPLRPPPDSMIALCTRPFAAGEVSSMCIIMPPADSPNAVTFAGSPPNAAALFLTHFIAAMASMNA
jgi:hypothetical protein